MGRPLADGEGRNVVLSPSILRPQRSTRCSAARRPHSGMNARLAFNLPIARAVWGLVLSRATKAAPVRAIRAHERRYWSHDRRAPEVPFGPASSLSNDRIPRGVRCAVARLRTPIMYVAAVRSAGRTSRVLTVPWLRGTAVTLGVPVAHRCRGRAIPRAHR